MLFKCTLFLFIIQFALHLTQESDDQEDVENIFRPDYEYILDSNCHYKIHTLPRTKSEAEAICSQEGAELFLPENDTEALVVINFWFNTQPFIRSVHINLTKKEVLSTKDYSHLEWSQGEPNNAGGNEECLVLKDDGTLNDENCNSKYPFICKKPHKKEWNSQCHMHDPDYKYNKNTRRCYKFHLTPKNWTDAYSTCYRELSYLAVADDEQEAAVLADLISNTPVVKLNSNDLVHLGFFNRDGWITRTGVPIHDSYHKWDDSQPDGNLFEDCGAMDYKGFLHDIPCYRESLFICEHEVPMKFL